MSTDSGAGDAGGVGAQVGLGEGVAQHRLDERFGEVGELLVPAAHRRAREHQAVAGVDLREASAIRTFRRAD